MVFNTSDVKRGSGEVSGQFKHITTEARRTGREVTKALNVPTTELVRNLRSVETALKRINEISRKGNLAEITKAAAAASRAELREAQRTAREKEKFQQEELRRAKKFADEQAREALRLEREKQKLQADTAREADRHAQHRLETAQRIAREERRIAGETVREQTRQMREQWAIQDRARREAERAQRARDSRPAMGKVIGGGMQQTGGGMLAAGTSLTATLTAPLALFAKYSLDVGTQYDAAMNMFRVSTSATADEMQRAADKALELGADMTLPATSAANAAEAMVELGKAGFTSAQAIDAARGVLQLAAAANISEAQAAEIAANAINSFGLAASESTRIADLLAASANASSAEITDVAAAMQQSSAVFASAKVPIEDLTTLIGIMANNGIKGSDAGTSLKTMLMRMQAPTKDAAAAMKGLGVDVFDAQGKLIPFREIVNQFSGSLSKLNDEQKAQALQTIFGADAMRAATIIFGKGTETYDKMKDAVTKQGAAADVAAARTKGLGGAIEGLKSQFETFALLVYNNFKGPLETAVRAVADWLGTFGDKFNAFAQAHPEIVKLAGVFLALAAAVGPVLVILGGVVLAVGSIVAAGSAIAGAVAAIGGIGPVLVIVGAALAGVAVFIAQAAVAAYGLYTAWTTNFAGVRDFTVQIFSMLRGVVTNALNSIRSAWSANGANIIATARATWTGVIEAVRPAVAAIVTFARENFETLVSWVRENWPLIKQTVAAVLGAIVVNVRSALGEVLAFWQAHGSQIKAVVSAVWTILKTVIQTGMRVVLDVIRMALQIINGDWLGAWTTMQGLVARVVMAIGTILKSLLTILWNVLKGLVTSILHFGGEFLAAGVRIGKAIVDGIINGIKAGASAVGAAAKWLANKATFGATDALEVRSPSRVFWRIGRHVAMGFALGIASLQGEADAAIKRLVIPKDIQTVQGKGAAKINAARRAEDKKNRPGYDLLEKVYQDIDSLAPAGQKTRELEVRAELAGEKYRDLAGNIREALIEAARYYDQRKANLATGDELNNQLDASAKKLLEFKYAAKEGASEVEKFDLWLAQTRAESPLAAAALDRAAEKIKAVRDAWASVDAAETARKQAEAAAEVSKAVSQMADDSSVALRDYGTVADTNLEKIIEKLSRLKGVGVSLSQFNPVKDLAASIRELPEAERLTKIAEALERIYGAAGARPPGMSDADWQKFIAGGAQGIDNSARLDAAEKQKRAIDDYQKLMEGLNEKLIDNNQLTEEARIKQELLRGAYKDLTEEQRRHLVERAREVDQRQKEIEAAERQREKLEELANSVTGIFDRALDDLFEHGFKGFFTSVLQGFKDLFKQIVKDFLMSGIRSVINSLFGLDKTTTGQSSAASSGGGSFIGTLLGGLFGGGNNNNSTGTGGGSVIGAIIKNLGFGGRSASAPLNLSTTTGASIASFFGPSLAAGLTGNTAMAALTGGTLTQQISNQVFSDTAKNTAKSGLGGLLANAGSLFRGIGFGAKPGTGGALAAMLPLLGAGLGGGLVGSIAGPQAGGMAKLLGMVGGGLVGIGLTATPAIFAAGGSLASMGGVAGALFSNPITAIAGAAALVGGLLFGRQRQRRADEQRRNAGLADSFGALEKIKRLVETDQLDRAGAVAQIAQVKEGYMQMAQSLKDSKARRHAILNASLLQPYEDRIMVALALQEGRAKTLSNRRPEFARGGVIPGALGQPVPIIGHGGEIFINPGQMAGVGAAVLSMAGVPGVGALPFAGLPSVAAVRPDPRDGGRGRSDDDFVIEEMRFSFDAEGMWLKGARTRSGRRVIVETIREDDYESGR